MIEELINGKKVRKKDLLSFCSQINTFFIIYALARIIEGGIKGQKYYRNTKKGLAAQFFKTLCTFL